MNRWLALLLPALAGLVAPARADDNRPLTVGIVEEASGAYRVTWKIPANVEERHLPALEAPRGCEVKPAVRQWFDPFGHWREEQWHCRPGLAGSAITVTYPFANPNLATIARLHLQGGAEHTLLLPPQETELHVPQPADAPGAFADFLHLGVEHIWLGIDHLLFVAGLIFVAGTPRRVMATITGFTLAHSMTLAFSALDLIRLPTSAVEGVIALSIVFLAVEIVKGPRATITWRRPVAVAGSFGLLHGFGFAAVLREVGLPEEGLLTALFAFNLGIEIGQVFFASALMLALAAARRIGASVGRTAQLQKLGGYALGILASFWMFERLGASHGRALIATLTLALIVARATRSGLAARVPDSQTTCS